MLETLSRWFGLSRTKIPAADPPGHTEHLGEPAPHGLPPPWDSRHFPPTATPAFRALAGLYAETDIEFPHLKGISLAQWARESGWGTSNLARDHRNYAGMKWRNTDSQFGSARSYTAHDGRTQYTHFNRDIDFIRAYWARLDTAPYKGWRDHVTTAEDFIAFIGPTWVGRNIDPQYVNGVLYIYLNRIAV
jgi:hypothetical protein